MSYAEVVQQATEDFEIVGLPFEKLRNLINSWNEDHRVYHDLWHLIDIIRLINAGYQNGEFSSDDARLLRLIAWYHDKQYIIGATDNETQSANDFLNDAGSGRSLLSSENVNIVWAAINDTADHTKKHSSRLSQIFIRYDLNNLLYGSLGLMIADGTKMMKEYGRYDWSLQKMGRLAVMQKYAPMLKEINPQSKIDSYIDFLEGYTPNIAIFPGTFFPYHKGHDDIRLKAEKIFDKVILAPGINPMKADNKDRIAYVDDVMRKLLPTTQIEYFTGFLHELVKTKDYGVTVVKGLRNTTDFDAEKVQLRYMEDMMPGIKVAYIISDRTYEHISSTGIRSIEMMDPARDGERKLTDIYLPS
jgi:pantetheine-phosphate adenylyltransferase